MSSCFQSPSPSPSLTADSLVFGIDLSITVDRTGVIILTEGTVPACVRDMVEALRQEDSEHLLVISSWNLFA